MIPPAALRLNKRQLDGMQEMAGMTSALATARWPRRLSMRVHSTAEPAGGRRLREVREPEGLGAFLVRATRRSRAAYGR